jgi:glucose-6-phosphate isomerase
MLSARLGAAGPAVASALAEAREARVVERIWDRDASLWSSDPAVQATISNRLGWLDAPGWAREHLEQIASIGSHDRVLLLGMGGSSLAPEVVARTFSSGRLRVLDSTDPIEVAGAEGDWGLVCVSSKSGETIETRSHAAYVLDRLKEPARFVAVTDPGSPLEATARERRFAQVLLNPADVGGRYSALTYFGLVPCGAAGIDVEPLLDAAEGGAASCRGIEENPGLELGVALAELARAGRDKVTIVASPAFSSFGAWAEQLLAESTGKEGTGLVPVDGEPVGSPDRYGEDRVFVHLRHKGSRANRAALTELERAGHPVLELTLTEPADLGAQFFVWEFATAVAGWRLGVNPFDEPNVSESKQNTARLIEAFERDGALPVRQPDARARGVRLYGSPGASGVAEGMRALLADTHPGEYVALQAFVPRSPETAKSLTRIRSIIRDRLRVATTVGFGPRFLHSTGQLHKGGPATGCFIQITCDHPDDVAIPGRAYSFGVLQAAQAAGDLDSLARHGRPAVRVHLSGGYRRGLSTLARIVNEATA